MTNIRPTGAQVAGTKGQRREHGFSRPAIILAALFLVGAAVAGGWFLWNSSPTNPVRPVATEPGAPSPLSDATLAVLQRISAPVEIRFYALLDGSPAAAPRREFAQRVAELLTEYEHAGGGRIVVKRLESPSAAGSSAAADGIEPLRLGRGDLNYLGIAVIGPGQKAVLPSLAQEWEAALEFDLSRAIARVGSGTAAAGEVVLNPAPISAASPDEILKVIPELELLSRAEAAQKVKAMGLEEFKVAVAEMQAQLADARQRLVEAQKESPEAEQVARKKLAQLPTEQNEKLGEISSRMQGHLAAVRQLKRVTQ